MKKFTAILLSTLLILTVLTGCTKDSSNPTNPTNTGTVDGYFRLPNGSTFNIPGATITVAGKTATTASDGYFSIAGIDAGTYLLTMTKGIFTASDSVTVVVNQTTSQTLYSDSPNSSKTLVIYDGQFYDNLTTILAANGINYDSVTITTFAANPSTYLNGRVYVYLISDANWSQTQPPTELTQWANQQGNRLYASGEANYWLTVMFPGNFTRNTVGGDAGTATNITLETNLSNYIGGTLTVVFTMPFPAINSIQTNVTPLITGTVPLDNATTLDNSPIAFTWKEGGSNGGTIIFTNFYSGMKAGVDLARIYLAVFF